MNTIRNTQVGGRFLIASMLVVSLAATASAQSGTRNPISSGSTGAGGGGTGLGGASTIDSNGTVRVGGGGGGASTATSARLHGLSDVIRARAEAQRSISQAAINNQTARGKAIQNKIANARSVVAIREARVAADRIKREYQTEVRTERQARLAALRSRPKRIPATLKESEFDRYTGKVAWPASIRNQKFAAARQAVEKELAAHVMKKGDNEAQLLNRIDALQKTVGQNARRLGYRNFAAANNFTTRLRNHIRYSEKLMAHRAMLAGM